MTILNGIFKTYDLSDSFFKYCINELGAGVHLVPVSLSVVRRTTRDNIVDIRFCYNYRDPLPFPRSLYRALVKNFPTSYSACFLKVRIYPCGGIRIYNIIFEDATYEVATPINKTREYNPRINKKKMMKDYLLELKIKLKEERNKIDTDGSLSNKQKYDKQKELTQHYTNLRKQKHAEVKSIKVVK